MITGLFYSQITLGEFDLSSPDYGSFIAKINSDGSFDWVKKSNSIRDIDAFEDGSFVTTTSGGNADILSVTKSSENGDVIWTVRAEGTSNVQSNAITSLPNGESIITGAFSGRLTFGDVVLSAPPGDNLFVAKINNEGSFEWAKQPSTTDNWDYSQGMEISSFEDGSAVITGTIKDLSLIHI